MPDTDRFFQIGQVLKSNGTDGQVLIGLRGVDAEEISEKEPVFIFVDGLPVPYFVGQPQRRGSSRILAYLTGVKTLEDAQELAGASLWMSGEDSDNDVFEDFTGWTLKNSDGTVVGVVDGLEDIPGNPCLVIGQTLVPLHEDLIESMEEAERVLTMNIPDGLII